MPITFRHDAAGVALPSNSASRKYGQQLVLQQQQQKYQGQQAGYDRLFQLGRDAQQNQFQFLRDTQQAVNNANLQDAQNKFQLGRDKTQFEQQQQQQEAARQRAFMDEARKQSSGMLMQDIQNGNYDPATARKLQQTLVDESEAMGNKTLDATQRAEALESIRGHRAYLSSLRIEKPPAPTRDEQLKSFLGEGYDQHGHLPWIPDGKGGFTVSKEALAAQQQEQQKQQQEAEKMRPQTAQDYYNHPDNKGQYEKDLNTTMSRLQENRKKEDPAPTEADAWAEMQKRHDLKQQQLGKNQYGEPTAVPELPAGAPPAVPGESRSILEGPTTQPQAPGMPPAPATPQTAAIPDQGQPPAPSTQPASMSPEEYASQMKAAGYELVTPSGGGQPYFYKDGVAPQQSTIDPQEYDAQMKAAGYQLVTPENGGNPYYYKDGTPAPPVGQPTPAAPQAAANTSVPLTPNSSSQNPAASAPTPAAPQQVKVGGKPLAVTPGTLTPQETAARSQIMELPQEDRIKALMPYDPQLKGRSLEQVLEDPESKRQYDELTKQGLTTGNYREDMLNHMDEMLQHNVLNGAGQSKPDAYVGMRADDVTDPKAKAEIAKLPRPKSSDERNSIRSGQSYVDPDGIIRVRA